LVTHTLRHSNASRLIKGNLSIQLVGKILGHQNVNTTYRYLTANNDTLFQAASILETIQIPSNNDSQMASDLIN
jgi:site-specific recombinase XerD